jgi:outer membrane protein OmpA-like peptidoglycan-associated protein
MKSEKRKNNLRFNKVYLMRKLMLALAFVGFTTSAFAQETTVPASKYSVSTNSFWSNWFVTVGGDFNAMYTSQEDCCNKNPFSVDRGTFGFDVALGKWFTPSIGLRTKVQGIWAKQVNTRDDHHSYKNLNVHEDVMFNLHNLFGGYKKDRVWNIIPYFGLGYAHNFDNGGGEFSYNAGLLNNFRINDRLGIYFDVYTAWMEGNFDGAKVDGWNSHAKFTSRHWDKMVGASLGLTVNLGKTTWEKTPDVAALVAMNKEQVDALNKSLKDQQDENGRLRDLLANQKEVVEKEVEKEVEKIKETTRTQFANISQSVFFNIGSAKIASRKDLVNVKELAEYAIENNAKLLVTGYADNRTGSAELNQALSEQRAQAVVEELVNMGVSRDNIVVESKGGVDAITPFSYNRRVTVKLQ